MKILLFGALGQVGHELAPLLAKRGEVVGLSRADLDFADLDAVRAVLARERPDAIVNAAAYNEVDRAETETAAALRLNAEFVGELGRWTKSAGAALIHYSTDFVFDGEKDAPYVETDAPNPLSAYGRSKREGERVLEAMEAPAVVLRTAWVYSLRRKSFVSMMLKLARERETLSVVTDQIGSPTFARDLASATALLLDRLGPDPGTAALSARGVYHAAGSGACSRAELALAALELDPKKSEHAVRTIHRVTADAFPAPARRPRYSALSCDLLRERFGVSLPPWKEALGRALASQPFIAREAEA